MALALLSLVPLVFLIHSVLEYHVDVPVLDEWELVPLLQKSYEGTLTFHDFWNQHNEHRLLFPLPLLVLMARLSHWNITYELTTNIVIATLTCGALMYQVYRTGRMSRNDHYFWLFPIISVMVFGLNQGRNWLLGWQMQMHLNVFAVVLTIVLLSNFSSKTLPFCLALFLGFMATYSFANGMLVWAIGLGVLLFSRRLEAPIKIKRILMWLVVSSFVIASYLYHYKKPEGRPSLLFLFKNPFVYLKYVFAFLGGPLGFEKVRYSIAFGIFVLVLLMFMVFFLIRTRKVDLDLLLPYIGLSLYSIMSAAAGGVWRCSFGCDQALYLRYVTITMLLWISVTALLYLLIVTEPKQVSQTLKRKSLSIIGTTLIIAILILFTSNSLYAVRHFKFHKKLYSQMRLVLYLGVDSPQITYLYPSPDLLFQKREVLKKYDLSVFHNPPPLPEAHRPQSVY